jgi:hypothetical protein
MKGGRYMVIQKSTTPDSEASQASPPKRGMCSESRKAELAEKLDSLMKRWCKRGALRPIQVLLRAYPGPLWHTYHQMELIDALENLNRLDVNEMEADERLVVAEGLNLLRRSLPGEETSKPQRMQRTDKPL